MQKHLKQICIYTFMLFTAFATELDAKSGDNIQGALTNDRQGKTFSVEQIESYIDSANSYLSLSLDSASAYILNAYELSTSRNMRDLEARSILIMGKIERRRGHLYLAMSHLKDALQIFSSLNDTLYIADTYMNMGIVFEYLNDYSKSLKNYQIALQLYTELNNTRGIAKVSNNIGGVFHAWGQFDNTLKYYFSALEISENAEDDIITAATFNNIGNVYCELEDYEEAIDYFNKSLEIKKKLKDDKNLSSSYNNLGNVFFYKQNYDKALEYFNKSIEIDKKLGNKRGESTTLDNIAALYIEIGKYDEALGYCKKSLEVARSVQFTSQEKNIMHRFAEIYSLTGDYKNAYLYHQDYTRLKDSIFNATKYKQLVDLDKKYETQRQYQEILLLSKDKQLKDALLKRNRIVIISLIFGALLLFSLAFVIFKRYRLKKTANEMLIQRNIEIRKKNQEIEKQKNELEIQRDLATRQHDRIKLQQAEILDSINYARYIQTAFLPPVDLLYQEFEESFIFYLPRDIVSGDYYWINVNKNEIIIAAADCTGHGVPGGFLSMLGLAYLNDIIAKQKLKIDGSHLTASDILNQLRELFISSLNQTGNKNETADGMDISLVIIDKNRKKLQFSGANNPLYLLRELDSKAQLIEYKADRMPIGIHRASDVSFSNTTIELKNNDILYIFTDGYIDQFGGNDAKKFKPRRFRQLLMDNYSKPMKEQHQVLFDTFTQWKGEQNQVDDILIIGIRIEEL